MRTLLMLGGSDAQLHAIRRAKELGLRVITCDDRPANPGHALADEYHEVSTTDVGGVLELAIGRRVDGVLAYASDPAALTAALVADRLGLPGDPPEAVRQAQDKLLLRAAQRRAGLPAPGFVDAADVGAVRSLLEQAESGVIVKPTDSSGSRGITVLPRGTAIADIDELLLTARRASRSGRAIAEVLWDGERIQTGGAVLVDGGRVRFANFVDQIGSAAPGSLAFVGNLTPSSLPDGLLDEARRQVQTLVSELGLHQGVYDVECRLDRSDRVTIVDFGARLGGNLLGIVHRLATGVDLVTASIRIALGDEPSSLAGTAPYRHAGHAVIHSLREGTLEQVHLSDELRRVVRETVISARPGDAVRPYRTTADRLGVIAMASDRRDDLTDIYARLHHHLGVRLVEDAAS